MEQVIDTAHRPIFEPGVDVVLRIGKRELRARVVEDRGPIGLDGTQVVRVSVTHQDVDEPAVFEVPVTALSLK